MPFTVMSSDTQKRLVVYAELLPPDSFHEYCMISVISLYLA